MRFNIIGTGVIPRVGMAPIRDVSLSESSVREILGYGKFKVYESTSGISVTPKNVTKIFVCGVTQTTTMNHSVPVEKPTPVVEIKEEPVVVDSTPVVEESHDVVEVVDIVETTETDTTDIGLVEDSSEEISSEEYGNTESPNPSNRKHKKRK